MRKNIRSSVPPEGFRYRAEVLTLDEEQQLVGRIQELPLKESEFHGYVGQRRTEWEQSIPAVDALRYSNTFRSLRSRSSAGSER